MIGYIDRIGPPVQDGYVITDFKTGKSDSAGAARQPAARHLLPGGPGSPDLAEFQPVKTVELAFLRGLEEHEHRLPQVDGHRARRRGLPDGDARAPRRR